MVSTKPYLIRALWQWCVDQGQTPYLVVEVDASTQVPAGYVKDGQITLNIGLEATNQLDLGNEFISFQARFGGVAQQIFVPISRVAAIFARESQEGMGFEVEDDAVDTAQPDVTEEASAAPQEDDTPPPSPAGGGRPRFTVVK